MRFSSAAREVALVLFLLVLLTISLFGPTVLQPADHHHFADARRMLGIPFAMDVLSNLPFALAGMAGLWTVWRTDSAACSMAHRANAALFFCGILLTALASGWYHLQPDDAGLAIDRSGMAVAFAGLLGLAAASRVSERAGVVMPLVILSLAPFCIQAWQSSGNVLAWAVLQFGGMALVVGLALLRAVDGALPVRWIGVIGAYAVAKLLEMNDHAVFELTHGLVSGHSLKHTVAALAAVPVLQAFRNLAHPRENGRARTASAAAHGGTTITQGNTTA